MAAAATSVGFDPWKYGTVLPWEKHFNSLGKISFKVTSLWDKVSLYTGFSHFSYLKEFQKGYNEQQRVVQELETTVRNDLTHFRHDLVRMILVSDGWEVSAKHMNKHQIHLTTATNRLPIIVRQIAQLFQAILFWYRGYEKTIQSLQAQATALKKIIAEKKSFKVTLGTMTFNNKSHTLVATPYIATGQGTIRFSGGVLFDVYTQDQYGQDKSIAGITVANSWVVGNERLIECQFHGKNPSEVKASDPALLLIAFNNFGKSNGFTDEMLQNIVLHIFSRGDHPKLVSNGHAGSPLSTRSELQTTYKDRYNSFHSTFSEGPMMPKFWITDPASLKTSQKHLSM